MTLYYSPSKNAFFDDQVNPSIPSDKVAITSSVLSQLLGEQGMSGTIGPGAAGQPVIVPFPARAP